MRLLRNNLRDALCELRHAGSAWLEVAFACTALSAGAWSYAYPYASNWFEAPDWVVAWIFMSVGVLQLGAFLGRNVRWRMSAAAICCAHWAGVSWVMIVDHVPGWMTATAPIVFLFEIIVYRILERQRFVGGRRRIDAPRIDAPRIDAPRIDAPSNRGPECG